MKKLLIVLLLLTMAFSLASCDYYEKAIRVTTGFDDPKLPENPSVSDTTDSGEKKTEPADTHDLTVPPITNPSDDENNNKIPDHLETTEKPALTESPVVTDDPLPPPTESPAPETQPPATQAPVTQPPATEAPTEATEAPTTLAPIVTTVPQITETQPQTEANIALATE